VLQGAHSGGHDGCPKYQRGHQGCFSLAVAAIEENIDESSDGSALGIFMPEGDGAGQLSFT